MRCCKVLAAFFSISPQVFLRPHFVMLDHAGRY